MRRDTVAIHNVLGAKLQCFPHMINFITKLNFNQLNIKKNQIDEDNFRKKYYKKRKHKRNWKKTM